MKTLLITIMLAAISAQAADSHSETALQDACKADCPSAKSEDEAHACMKGIVKNKKNDKKFRKSDCYSAFKEHEKHEKDHGHKH